MRSIAKTFTVVATSVLTIASLVTFESSAYARTITVPTDTEDGKTVTRDLMTKCNKDPDSPAHTCKWTNVKVEFKDGTPEIVGTDGGEQKFVNCGSGEARQHLTWSRSTGSATSLGGSVTLGGAFGGIVGALFGKLEADAELGLEHTWTKDRTYTTTTEIQIAPGETGWIVHTDSRVVVTGNLEVIAGANTWILGPITVDAPHKTDGGVISTHSRKHTLSDRGICEGAPKPDTVSGATNRRISGPTSGHVIAAPYDE